MSATETALDEVAAGCAEIFREVAGLQHTPEGHAMSDAEMLAASIESFGIDSLTTMEFIMGVEDRFDVELDEAAVNGCSTIGELVGLVRQGRDV